LLCAISVSMAVGAMSGCGSKKTSTSTQYTKDGETLLHIITQSKDVDPEGYAKSIGKFQNMDLCTSDMKQLRYRLFYAFLWLIMLLWFTIVILPCLWLAVLGFKTAAEINASQNVTFFPKEFD